jgi:hypothetical protein
MITRGDVSLDVEDKLGPDDWPLLSDIATDSLRHSVHLPLDPKVIMQEFSYALSPLPSYVLNIVFLMSSKIIGGQEGTNRPTK